MDTSDGKSMDLINSDYNGLPQAVQQVFISNGI